jgi:hypothetical protein
VVLLLERVLVSWLLGMDECGGHEDLWGLGQRSIIPYVHRRAELYCSSLPCLSLSFFRPCEVAPARTFCSSRLDSYIETQGPTGGPEVVETSYNI